MNAKTLIGTTVMILALLCSVAVFTTADTDADDQPDYLTVAARNGDRNSYDTYDSEHPSLGKIEVVRNGNTDGTYRDGTNYTKSWNSAYMIKLVDQYTVALYDGNGTEIERYVATPDPSEKHTPVFAGWQFSWTGSGTTFAKVSDTGNSMIRGDHYVTNVTAYFTKQTPGFEYTYSNGILTFDGPAGTAMPDYTRALYPNAPWYQYHDSVTKVVFTKNIRYIGASCCQNFGNLTQVVTNDGGLAGNEIGTTRIGPAAFYGCSSLSSFSFPDNLKTIRNFAFAETGLTSVTIPDSLRNIGHYTFYNCTNLTSVTFGANLHYIGERVFQGCTALTSVTFPGPFYIGESSFRGCTSLSNIIFEGPAVVSENAFAGDKALQRAVIPAGSRINANAFAVSFYNDQNLLSAGDIPGYVYNAVGVNSEKLYRTSEKISYEISAESGYAKYGSVFVTGGTSSFMADDGTPIVVNGNVITVGNKTITASANNGFIFEGWEITTEGLVNPVTGYRNVVAYTTTALSGTSAVGADSKIVAVFNANTTVTWEIVDGILTVSGSGYMPNYGAGEAPWYSRSSEITGIAVTGLKNVGNNAFRGLSNAETVSLPAGTEFLGDYAFYGCTALESVIIPAGTEFVGKSCFEGCTALASVDIAKKSGVNTATDIRSKAFNGCTALEHFGAEMVGDVAVDAFDSSVIFYDMTKNPVDIEETGFIAGVYNGPGRSGSVTELFSAVKVTIRAASSGSLYNGNTNLGSSYEVFVPYGTTVTLAIADGTGTATIAVGETVIRAVPNADTVSTHYYCNRWVNANGDTIATKTYTVTDDFYTRANFSSTPRTYTVAVESGDGGTVKSNGTEITQLENVKHGSQIRIVDNTLTVYYVSNGTETVAYTLVAVPDTGAGEYSSTFDRWLAKTSADGTYAPITSSFRTNSATSIKALFSENLTPCTVTVQVNDLNLGHADKSTLDVPYGSVASINGNVLTFTKGERETGTVTATPMDISGSAVTVDWKINGTAAAGQTITGASTLAITFTEVSGHTVTIVTNHPYGTVSVSSYAVNDEDVITVSGNDLKIDGTAFVTATAKAPTTQYYYRFTGWTAAGSNGSALTFPLTVSENVTLTANFQRTVQTYTVSFVSENAGKGTVDTASIAAKYGDVLHFDGKTVTCGTNTVKAVPAASYDLEGWYNGAVKITQDVTVKGNLTITAKFDLKSWKVTFAINKSGYGTVSKGTETVAYADVSNGAAISVANGKLKIGDAEFTANPSERTAQYSYEFTGWSPATGAVTQDMTITANFERSVNTYAVVVNGSSEHGTVQMKEGVTLTAIAYGTPISVSGNELSLGNALVATAVPAAGYHVEWKANGAVVTADSKITGNTTIGVSFVKNGLIGHSIEYYDDEIFVYRQTVSSTSAATDITISQPDVSKDGYHLKGWKATDGTIYKDGDVVKGVTADGIVLTAVWEKNISWIPIILIIAGIILCVFGYFRCFPVVIPVGIVAAAVGAADLCGLVDLFGWAR